jgi:hypothetical protein
MAKTIPLSSPLKSHDGEITKLELRDMTASDIVLARVAPYRIVESKNEDERHTEYRFDIVMQLASRLSGIDDLVLGGLKAKDFHAVTLAVVQLWNAAGE